MLKSAAIYFAGRAGGALIALLSVAVVTRLLSAEEYGVYALVMSGASMAYAGMLQWLTFSLGRFLPAYQDHEEILLSHVMAAYAGMALIAVLSASLVALWLPPGMMPEELLPAGVVILLTYSFAELNLTLFQMRGMPLAYARFALARITVAAAIGIALAYLGWGSLGLLIGVVAGHLCIILPNLHRHWRVVRFRMLEADRFRALAAYGFPFALTGGLAAVISVSDRYIIGALMGAGAAGLYAAPYDIAMRSLHVLMMVVAMASQPLVLRAYESGGKTAALPIIRRQGELLLGVALPAAIGCILLSPAIAHLLLGQAFQQAARELMPWIAAATILAGFQAFYLALAFSLPKAPLRQAYVFVGGAAINVALNFLLIPPFGLIGAALATIVAYLAIALGSFLVGRRLFPLPVPRMGFAKIILACTVWGLILWPVSDTTDPGRVLLQCIAAGAAYLAVFWALDVGNSRQLVSDALRSGYSFIGVRRAEAEP